MIIPKLDPFPHAIIDGHFPNWLLDKVLDEFPPPDAPWRRYGGENEQGKAEGSNPAMWGEYTCDLLSYLVSDPEWLAALCDAFHIKKLVGDTIGGGYHQIETGGRLGVHVDFNRHPSTGLHRRLNCLVYLNHDWQDSYGGALELHGEDGTQIDVAPKFNRTVVFATSERSWHGHPVPWAGPTPRRSVAVYYFSPEPAPDAGSSHSTVWKG